jgi:limonene-1,2-epoxide hydrolase
MSVDEVVAALFQAVERGDIDGVLALMTSDCEYDNVPIAKAIGHEAIRQTLGWFVAVPGADADGAGIGVRMVKFEIVRQAVQGNLLFNERVDHLLVGGKAVQMPVCGVWEIDPEVGKIRLWRDYFDMEQINAQIGSSSTGDSTESLRRLMPE